MSWRINAMDSSEPLPANNGSAFDPDTVYFNGIDPETGQYAIPPTKIEDMAKAVLARPGFEAYEELHGDRAVPFAPPFGMRLDDVSQVGWGIVFHEDTPQEIRDALAPLVEHRTGELVDDFADPFCRSVWRQPVPEPPKLRLRLRQTTHGNQSAGDLPVGREGVRAHSAGAELETHAAAGERLDGRSGGSSGRFPEDVQRQVAQGRARHA